MFSSDDMLLGFTEDIKFCVAAAVAEWLALAEIPVRPTSKVIENSEAA